MTMTNLELGQLIIDEYESAADQSTFFSGNNAEEIAEQYKLPRDQVVCVMEQVQAEYETTTNY